MHVILDRQQTFVKCSICSYTAFIFILVGQCSCIIKILLVLWVVIPSSNILSITKYRSTGMDISLHIGPKRKFFFSPINLFDLICCKQGYL